VIGKDGRIKFQAVEYNEAEFGTFLKAVKDELEK
jgi:hypothetical protein